MKRALLYIALIIYGFLVISSLAADKWGVNSVGPWKGRIIDIETKEPLEGAVILAVWQRAYATPTGLATYFYEAKEVLTDKNGRFELSSYRPINLLPIISSIRGPLFTIFKPGYGSGVSDQMLEGYLTDKGQEIHAGTIDGKWYRFKPGVIELPKLISREERLKFLPGSSDPFRDHFDKKANYMKILNTERKALGLDPVEER